MLALSFYVVSIMWPRSQHMHVRPILCCFINSFLM